MFCVPFATQWPAITTVTVASILSVAAYLMFALLGWPPIAGYEEIRGNCFEDYLTEPRCYCERLRGSFPGDFKVAQPVNTLTSEFYVIVGLMIAYATDTQSLPKSNWWNGRNSLMATEKFYPIAYATFVCLVGPGSACLHASFREWASQVDSFTMVIVVSFLNVYGLSRVFHWTVYQAALFLGCLVVSLTAWTILAPPPSLVIYITLICTAAVLELVIRLRDEYLPIWIYHQPPKSTSDLRLVVAAVSCYLIAFFIWIKSKSGAPLCSPESVLQGHAMWHLLTAVSLGLLFLYALSEHHYVAERGDEESGYNGQGSPTLLKKEQAP